MERRIPIQPKKEVIIIQLPLIGTNIIVYSGNHYTFTFERVI